MATEGFGLRINSARVDAGLSQIELAAILGTEQPNISRWERERVTPRASVFEAIAKACNVSPQWLKYGNNPPDYSGLQAGDFIRYATDEEATLAAMVRTGRKRGV